MEAIVTDQEGKNESQLVTSAMRQSQPSIAGSINSKKGALLNFDFFTYVSAHSSLYMSTNQKKIFQTVYPLYPIMASVGDDETLRFWDLNKKQIIVSKNLGT